MHFEPNVNKYLLQHTEPSPVLSSGLAIGWSIRIKQVKLWIRMAHRRWCITDLRICSTHLVKKGSNGQLLNIEESSSPQPTLEAIFDGNATKNVVSQYEQGVKGNDSTGKKSSSRSGSATHRTVPCVTGPSPVLQDRPLCYFVRVQKIRHLASAIRP